VNFIWSDFKIPVGQDEAKLPHLLAARLKIPSESLKNWRILRRSIDARKKPEILFVYTVEFSLDIPSKILRKILTRFPQLREKPPEKADRIIRKPDQKLVTRPIIIGAGPAGYFAALALAEKGYRPLVLERGDRVDQRTRLVKRFWETGVLDTESNVQFGEGGAGTFSDGKLTTRIEDSRISEVLERFVECGANAEILYVAKPHIGTDVLKTVVASLREKIIALGGEIVFRTKVTNLKVRHGRIEGVEINHQEMLPAQAVILAVGHSARDMYDILKDLGIHLESKPFAIGLRVEHPQALINKVQYGISDHPQLGAADYQLTYKDAATGRGVYSFCMCPGGVVVAASSEERGVVTNGMSQYARNSQVANSAVVVTVRTSDFDSCDPLAGVAFQRKWEEKAFLAGGKNYQVPAQTVPDFLQGQVTQDFKSIPTYKPGYRPVNLHTILPPQIGEVMVRALQSFDTKIQGFAGEHATLTGIESRTSAPLRILRDETGQSVNLPGLFPAGEGAGYAGGITSSAVDGLRVAERLMGLYAPME